MRSPLRELIAFIALASFLCLTYYLYQPGLDGELILDDKFLHEELEQVDKGTLHWKDFVWRTRNAIMTDLPYRPISLLTFYLDYLVNGADVKEEKSLNLYLHLLAGLLVFWLAILILRLSDCSENDVLVTSLMVTALWLLSPMSTSTVLYSVQRMTILSAIFSFATLILYFSMRLNASNSTWVSIVVKGVLGLFVLMPMAFLSKENSLVLPLIVVFCEVIFFRNQWNAKYWRYATKIFYLGVATLGLVLTMFFSDQLFGLYDDRPFTMEERLLTEGRVLVDYVTKIIIPAGPEMGLYHDDYIVSKGIFSPISTLYSWGVLVALLVIAYLSVAKRQRLVPFAIGFFLIGHLIESTVLPLEIYYEHRNYMPQFSVLLGLSVLLVLTAKKLPIYGARWGLMSLIIFVYSFSLSQRAIAWGNWGLLLNASILAHPYSKRLNTDLAIYDLSQGDLGSALERLRVVDDIYGEPSLGVASQVLLSHCWVGVIPGKTFYDYLGRVRLVHNDNYTLNVTMRLVNYIKSGKCNSLDGLAIGKELERLEMLGSSGLSEKNLWLLNFELAKLYSSLGDYERALKYARNSMRIAPDKLQGYIISAQLALTAGEIELAATIIENGKVKDERTNKMMSSMLEEMAIIVSEVLRNRKHEPVPTPAE